MKKLSLFFVLAAFFLPSLASADTTISGTISSNQTWTTAGGTYIISGTVTIAPGVTLTINPGVIVKFTGFNYLVNQGTLNAQGSTSSPIYFTSYSDDSVGGDTNANGTTTGAAGNWRAIETDPGGTTTITNAELRFSTYGFYNFGGALTLTASVATTSSWYGLLHEKGTTTVTTSTFENSGTYGIYVGGPGTGALTVSSSTITKNSATNVYGVYLRGTPALSFIGNSFATNTNAFQIDYVDGGPTSFVHSGNIAWGNPINGITVVNGTSMNVNNTWTKDTIPYVIRNEFAIAAHKTLTVNAGAVIKFYDSSSYLTVSGALNAQGSTSSPIYFTSLKDDTVGGDTNNNGSANVPNGGDWQYIMAPNFGTSTIDHGVIRYGGSNSTQAMVFGNGGVFTITNSEIASSSYNGIMTSTNGGVYLSTITISNSDIHDNGTSTGTYYGIVHLYGTTTIDHSTMRNHRAYALSAATGVGNLYLTSNTFSGNINGAVLINLAQNLNFTHYANTATGTGKGGIVLYGSPGKAQTWWGDPYLPYIISTTTGSVTINTYGVTVSPGAVLKMEGPTANIYVGSGSFIADSSASSSKIYFTSIKDDQVGGDTNGNGAANSPAAGDWDGIKVNTGASSTLNYAVVRYAGGTAGTSIWNNGGTMTLYNTEVATGTTYGIYESSGDMTVIASDIHDHSVGIQVGGTASIGSSWIHDNSTYGLYNSTVATSSVDAIYNYWGDASGPYHAIYNSSGTGDTVSNYVDFDPWLTEMHYLFVENGTLITAVDGSKDIDWGGTSDYMTAWYGGVDLWNSLGDVTIATDTISTIEDLTISDVNEPSEAFVAVYNPNSSPNDTIKFNDYYMASSTAAFQLNATAHELGHALGLWHSYIGNMMNSFVTSTTTLGYQDILDYDYCWISDDCR